MKKLLLFLFALAFGATFFLQSSNAQVSVLLNPSGYGYTFLNTTTPYTALTGGTVFQSSTTLNTDANSSAITLPFVFTYNGIKEKTVFINNNGYITFAIAQTTASNTVPISTTTTSGYDGAIAGLANNLVAAASGTPEIRYGTNAGGDFVIQFQDLAISTYTSTRATFQIILKVDGKTIQIVYGPNNTGQASATGSQVGLRGTCDEDWNNRSLASGGNWNTAGGAAGTVNTNTMTWTATSTLPTSGRTFQWSPASYVPTYLATPFTSCMEFTSWVNGAGPANLPSTNWATNGYGNASWQIDNNPGTTTTTGWGSATTYGYTPVDYVSASGGHSARFHSGNANSPQVGYLDYYVDFSSATAAVNLDFYQINIDGTDILQVFLSTNGGSTFTQVGSNIGVATTWTARSIALGAVTSATSIIRFKATSDFGSTDIGLDHVCLSLAAACPTPIALTAGSITTTTASISWTCTGCTGTFELDYGANPHTAGTGTIITTGVTSPYLLNPPLTSSTSYQVFVRQNCSGGGNGFSNWSTGATFTTLTPPPANDICSGAIVIPPTGPFPYITGVTDNTNATNTNDPTNTCQATSNKGVWYTYTPTATGSYIISSCQSDASSSAISDNVLSIFTSSGGCAGPFTQVACDDDACTTLGAQAIITTTLTSGTQYYILAYGYSTGVGNIQLKITAPLLCPIPTGLAAGSVTATTASISWTCTGCTGTFELDYGANPHTAGTGTIITGITTPYTLNPPLTPSTGYHIFVRQNCSGSGNGNSDWSTGATFTTLAPPPVCPGGLGVNSVSVGSLPYSTTGQTTCGSGNNVTSTNVVSACGSTSYYGAEDRTYIFTPTTTGVYTILLTTATDDDAGIMLYQGCPFTAGSSCVSNAQSTTGLTRTLTPTLTSGITYYLVVDNFPSPACIGTYSLSIDPPPTCTAPTGLAAGSITANSASISWTCAGCTGTYELDYGSSGHTAGTGTIISGVTSPFNLNPPLTSGTAYTIYIRQDCSGSSNGYSAWSSAVNFNTSCATIISYPYTMGFDGSATCWTVSAGTAIWAIGSTSSDISAPQSGTGFAYKPYTTSTQYLFSPPVDLSIFGSHTARLDFWIYRHASTVAADQISFKVNTSATSSGATNLQTFPILTTSAPTVPSSGWYNYTIDIPTSWNAAGTVYFVVEGKTTAGYSSYDIGLDKFTIEAAPTCIQPTALTANNYTAVGADLGWSSPSSFFDIFIELYGGPAPVIGTSPTVDNNPGTSYTWTGGNASTSYIFYVRTDCGGGDVSTWSGPYSFSTTCSKISSFPFTENFTAGVVPPPCWSETITNTGYNWKYNTGFADVEYDPAPAAQNEWLISPEFDFTGLTHPRLTFDWMTSYTWFVAPNDNGDFLCKISTNGGSSWSQLWYEEDEGVFTNYTWYTKRIDLSLYAGASSVKIAFQYIGNDAAQAGIDNIKIAESPATSTWTGTTNNSWSVSTNWNPDVPGSNTNVLIPAGLTNYPTLSSAGACNNISLGSTATSSATVLDYGFLTVNGTATVDRYFTGDPPPSTNDWHLVSSPVSNATADVFFGMYLQSFVEASHSYFEIELPMTPLNVMEGYGLYSTLNTDNTVSFTGNLNLGTKTRNFTADDPNPNPLLTGWNLMGNPFVSSIDWDAVTIPSGLSNEVHYIEASTGNDLSYVKLIGGSGSRYIAPMQGFFVKATGAGTLSLGNTQRTHTGAANFYKSDNPRLVTLEATGNSISDQALIHFNEQAGVEHDGIYDAYKRVSTSNPHLPQIYSVTPNGVKLSVNGLPEVSDVPVGFTAGEAGNFTINAINTGDFTSLTLEDTKTDIFADLLMNSYSFSFVPGESDKRFVLHFGPLSVNGVDYSVANIYSLQRTVYVNLADYSPENIYIYNIAGQLVATASASKGLNKLILTQSGNYIVKVITEKSTLVKKVFVQ